jgi:outer membrane protein assembly factor BamD (BamD/ComL family)
LNEVESQAFWEFNFFDKRRPMRDTFGHAVRVFDRIRIDDPTGRLADDATLAAGNAYFTAGRYLEADNFYTDLRKTFPSSEHQFRAHLLGVQAKLRSYQGSDYSGIPLDEAEKLIKQIRRQFPHEAEKNAIS